MFAPTVRPNLVRDLGARVANDVRSYGVNGPLMIFQLPKGKGPAWLRTLLDEMKRVPPGHPFNQRLTRQAGLLYEMEFDEHLEIDYHVRHTVLPHPGSDAQLAEVTARMHANLLDRDRPLWEFHLIVGLQGRRFAFYVKAHHAIGDGITFARWIDDSTNPSARITSRWRRMSRARPLAVS